ncbi:hypothetical protein KFL_008160030 [Klebsormidium nitens]|uniref:J domain-containing protein n=1 Tax=Klebsormidium nitens TaxID=105231 RepID=A0A1Y1ILT3_KLENI|nr:hypothetical protein KFL_008160030 [Klebsormidium nitens]|eukprot:GAQ91603.1 hypothetical protein KFL_008160030 [Klebsormidium nitens]
MKQQSNQASVAKYRTSLRRERAIFRAPHIAKYRALALTAVPEPPEPEAPRYTPPPISWLLADAQFTPNEVKSRFGSGEIQLSHSSWSLKFHPDKVEGRSANHLEDFQRHYSHKLRGIEKGEVERSHRAIQALYATELFAPLNEQRFKPGLIAQKAGGVLWKAWLNVEAALVTDYTVYLQRLAEFEEQMERSKELLDAARKAWVEVKLERRFRLSKAFRRCHTSLDK